MKTREHIEYRFVAGLLAITRRIPQCWVFSLFRGLGFLSYYIIPRRRNTALLNTEVVFPDKPLKQRKKIVRRHFLNMAESLALNSLITSGRITNEQLLEMVEVENWERIVETVDHSPRGVLFFSGHIGNWELMPQYAALRLRNTIHVIARKTNNDLLEERILLPLRERFGVKIFYKKNAMMRIMHAARKKEPIGLMVDQKLNLNEGIPIEFFGRTAGTTSTPAVLQIRLGIATIPVFMIMTGRRKYRLIVGDPVEWEDNGKSMEEQVFELTAVHQKAVEDMILKYPEQWFWVHDRWGLWKQRKHQ